MRKRRLNGVGVERQLREHALWRSSGFREGVRADFSDQDLSHVDLQGCDLSGARMRNTKLVAAYLVDTVFHGSHLQGASLEAATMFDTVFRRVDLSEVHGLETVRHLGPSTIGLDTLLRSGGRIPESFLVGAGVPIAGVGALRAWARKHGRRQEYCSAFISYGGPDEHFARRIHETLQGSGVETFFFAEHAEPGMKLFEVMSNLVNEYDRVVLLCSRGALSRRGVVHELDEVLRREAREGASAVLIPATLDDYVYSQWKPPRASLARAVLDRVIADFRGADRDERIFKTGIGRLLKALRRRDSAQSSEAVDDATRRR